MAAPRSSATRTAGEGEWLPLLAGLLGPMALALWLLPHQATPADDAFISFRYAWNLVHGHGLVYNAGERVEGFSNPLWTLLSAVPIALGKDPYPWMRALSVLSFLGLLAALFLAAPDRAGGRPRLVASTWLLASSVPLLAATESGLETTFFAALLFGGALAHERAREAGAFPGLACLLYALAAWTRPEAPALVAVLVLAGPREGGRRQRWAPLAAAALAFALLEAARLAYYGEWLPNTFHAKVGEHAVQARQGLRYLRDACLDSPLAPALALSAALVAPREALARRRHFLALAAFVAAYVAWIGGDWMPHARFLVVLEPFLLAWADEWLRGEHFSSPRRDLAFVALLVLLGTGLRAREVPTGLFRMADFEHGWAMSGGRVAGWLRDRGATGLIAIGDIGVVGWENRERLRVLDINGLVDKAIAAIPGRHMRKVGPAFRDRIFGARPDWIVISGDRSCDEPKEDSGAELYFDPRFKPGYELATRTNENARFGWCVFARRAAGP